MNYNQCIINVQTRKYCTSCRLKKCLEIGMEPNLIRKEDLHEKYRSFYRQRQKLKKKSTNICQSASKPCLFNLITNDHSLLTSMNWTLLSNVIHAFDTFDPLHRTQQAVRLCSTNQVPIDYSLDFMASIYTSLQSYINCLADFRILTFDEQTSLIQRNMQGLLACYCVFVFRQSGVFDKKQNENILLPLYGLDNVCSTKGLCDRLDYDATLMKLLFISLVFSSSMFAVDFEQQTCRDSFLYGTYRLFGSQNVYVEILWKYMIYKYDFKETIHRLSRLIKVVLDSVNLVSKIYYANQVHRDLVDDLSEQVEETLKFNGNDSMPLWGKD